ncbi:MAG: universal stress protein [Nitrospirae bacterium]|nr:universal stress protein [Nitrospirota bacterium]
MIRKILVATHGTENAIQAELHAIQLAQALGARLHGLYVIHKDWGSLVGIEWLHSSEKRMDFYRYAESELYRMADAALAGLVQRAGAHGITVTSSVRVGDPGTVIAEEAGGTNADLIVIGSNGSKTSEEYRAKVSLVKLMKAAPCSVLRVKADAGRGGEKLREQGHAQDFQETQWNKLGKSRKCETGL